MDGETGVSGRQPITAAEAREREEQELTMENNNEKVIVAENRASLDEDSKSQIDEDVDEPINDLFVSLPPLKGVPPEENPLTVRAVLVGIILGSLCNASNVYLGSF